MPQESVTVPVAGYTNIEVTKSVTGSSVMFTLDSYDTTDGTYVRENPARIALWPDEVEDLIAAYESVKDWQPEPEPQVEASEGVRWVPLAQREQFVQAFVDAQVPLRIKYTDEQGQQSDRVVSPIQIDTTGYGLGQRTWLHAWDHAKEGYRNFRLTRIDAIGVANETYVRTPPSASV